MKKNRVLRGQLADGETRRLIVDDGNFNDGWTIVHFVVAGDGQTSTECNAKICLDSGVPGPAWNWGDNREVAWASTRQTAESTWGGWEGAIDPNNVIIQDAFITGQSSNGSVINYMVTIERVVLSDDQAILGLIQERAQDDL